MSHWTPKDKARAYATYISLNRNIKRTARTLNIPAPTIRRWAKEWDQNGLPKEIEEELPHDSPTFILTAKRVRDKLLTLLEERVDNKDISTAQLNLAFGILSDKIRAAEGVTEARVEHKISLPPKEELKELFSSVMLGVVEAARKRAEEIEAIEEVSHTTFQELPPPQGG